MNKHLDFAIGHFLSDWGDLSSEEVLDILSNGDPDELITFWEPFEYYDPESMATMIEDLALYAEHTYSTQPANDTKAQVASINEGDHT